MRRNDYSLSDDQLELSKVLRAQLAPAGAAGRARDAEPSGFDDALWGDLVASGVVSLALSEEDGGGGGGLVELALAAFEAGRGIAAVPLVEHASALRLLARMRRVGADVPEWDSYVSGEQILSIAPASTWALGRELVPAGSIATGVVSWRQGRIVLLTRQTPPKLEPNDSGTALAWWRLDSDTRVTELGADQAVWHSAQGDWRVGTAALLSGLIDESAAIARRYSLERSAFGSPIAKFQAISHLLVSLYEAAETTRHLALKAAWLHDNDPAYRPELPAAALLHASRSALKATHGAVHVQAGMGISLESDISLYFRRASAWGLLGGGSSLELPELEAAIPARLERIRAADAAHARADITATDAVIPA